MFFPNWRAKIGDLSDPGNKSTSLLSLMFPALASRFFITSSTWEAQESSSAKIFVISVIHILLFISLTYLLKSRDYDI